MHDVLRALAARRDAGSQPEARSDGLRIALAIEGGGMRGVISGGMALALDERSLVPAFDALYGASAGAITKVDRPEAPRSVRHTKYGARPAHGRADMARPGC